MATATFGGGCFWCLEAVFEVLNGVSQIDSGYAGGARKNPSYEQVCSGATGHAEVIRVTYDPAIISYRQLLEIFFAFHDPTTADRQGPDVGTQYRSIILTESAEQALEAAAIIAELGSEAVFDAPIVTEITPLEAFWPAEANHREYYRRNPSQAYCRVMIAPKLAKLRARHSDLIAHRSTTDGS
jgi:peptide-methionine (S)-S-oxide reductase